MWTWAVATQAGEVFAEAAFVFFEKDAAGKRGVQAFDRVKSEHRDSVLIVYETNHQPTFLTRAANVQTIEADELGAA